MKRKSALIIGIIAVLLTMLSTGIITTNQYVSSKNQTVLSSKDTTNYDDMFYRITYNGTEHNGALVNIELVPQHNEYNFVFDNGLEYRFSTDLFDTDVYSYFHQYNGIYNVQSR